MAKFLFFITILNTLFGFTQTVSTLAGTTEGYFDGPGEIAQFKSPNGICADAQGNLFVADKSNNRIRKITTSGEVSTIAGSTEGYQDGVGTNAKFNFPMGICIDALGNLYVTELFNFKIRKITPAGVVTTFAGTTDGYLDGTVSTAKFSYPNGICLDSQGNFYITDNFNYKIRKISNTGVVTTIAGSTWGNEDGQGTAAKFDYPTGICRDGLGNLYVVDSNNHKIRKINPLGYVSTYAGIISGNLDGDINTALFCSPRRIMIMADGTMYVTQACGNPSVRKITSILNIENFVSNKMVLYPNPNEGTFEINLNETINIEIFNSLGSLVYAKKNVLKQIETNLLSGIYYLKISSMNNEINYLKMIIR